MRGRPTATMVPCWNHEPPTWSATSAHGRYCHRVDDVTVDFRPQRRSPTFGVIERPSTRASTMSAYGLLRPIPPTGAGTRLI